MRLLLRILTIAVAPSWLDAQPRRAPSLPPEAQQIAAAVLPLPREFRPDASVLGYRTGSSALVILRHSAGPFTCLASNPVLPQFHVACYHDSLAPFMERGRALRAQGVTGDLVDSARFREVRAGQLRMPSQPAALYSLTGPAGSFDPVSGTTKGARLLYVVYIPGATTASTGISSKPSEGAPWIMYPGTPKAHIMFVTKM